MFVESLEFGCSKILSGKIFYFKIYIKFKDYFLIAWLQEEDQRLEINQ
jgi:hypothetical protein